MTEDVLSTGFTRPTRPTRPNPRQTRVSGRAQKNPHAPYAPKPDATKNPTRQLKINKNKHFDAYGAKGTFSATLELSTNKEKP